MFEIWKGGGSLQKLVGLKGGKKVLTKRIPGLGKHMNYGEECGEVGKGNG